MSESNKKEEHLITHEELFHIVGRARQEYVTATFPIHISHKVLLPSENVHVMLLEAFLAYLNTEQLLTKPVKFDYKE